MKYWLIKSEPHKYSWDQLVKDGHTFWDGIRNYAARLNLLDMKVGDICLYYHSNEGMEIVGLAEVIKTAYRDPNADDERWVAVDVKALKPLQKPVTLAEMKAEKKLKAMDLIRISRLSVCKVTKAEFDIIMKMAEQP